MSCQTENHQLTMTKLTTIVLFGIALCSTCCLSCKKKEADTVDCFPFTSNSRQIVNAAATIRQDAGGQFYIVEQGTIDPKLDPCHLATDFKINNLAVTISCNVKVAFFSGPGPCCTEPFVITRIER